MIPILYAANETDFTTYGIGALRDTTSCIVTEQYNGEFEMIMQYPITGKLYEELAAERIIKAKAWDVRDPQLFRIYRISRPLRGIVTIYAQHISYDLAGIALAPFSGSYTAAGAMAYMFTGTPYTGISDKTGTKTVKTIEPKSVRAMLGGSEGSLLDLWGGEYTFNNFTVQLNVHRGSDKGVVIEYGKNLTELTADNDLTEVYTQLQPYARYTDADNVERVVTAPAISITSVISRTKTLIRDFTDELQLDQGVVPTAAQITAAATSWLSNNTLGYETPSITVSFEPAKGGADYPVVGLELGDTVTIRYTKLGVDVKARIVETEYDTLAERYKKMTIGKPRANMAATVASLTETAQAVQEYPNRWSDAIAAATKLITGNSGGYVVIHEGADGKPYEILIMDTPDINTAVNVWRWNINGLGFSSSGYAGPYATAITYDGSINADFISTGSLNAGLIQTGALVVKDSNDRVLFMADTDNQEVSVAGFDVSYDSLQYQSPGQLVDISASGVGSYNTAGAGAASLMEGQLLLWDEGDYDHEIRGDYLKLKATDGTNTAALESDGGKVTATDGTNTTTLNADGLSWDHGTDTNSSIRAYTLRHNSSSTAAATYTAKIPYGTYLFLHSRQTTPVAAAQGAQLVVIGQTSGTSALITTLDGAGSDLTATSGTRSQVTIGNTDSNQEATVTWAVQGRSYRRLVMMRLM